MNTKDLNPAAIRLRKGAIHRVHNGQGQRIEAVSGTLWITIDHDPRDIIIKAGEGFSLDRGGDTLISAFDDARFVLLEPIAARRH